MDNSVGNTKISPNSLKNLKPRWKPGESGNPSGRPKNPLKDFQRDMFKKMTDEEKVDFLEQIPAEIRWKMAEGNPDSKTETETTQKVRLDDKELQEINETLIRRQKGEDTPSPRTSS